MLDEVTEGEDNMRCTKCGRENNDTARFCARCRQPLGRAAPSAPPARPPQVFTPIEPDKSKNTITLVAILALVLIIVLVVVAAS